MNYCSNLVVKSTISDNVKNYNYYNNYITQTTCKCQYCQFFDKQIKNIDNDNDNDNDNNNNNNLNERTRNITNYHNNYTYSSYLNNIKNNLLKNDLYSKKIFSIL